MDVASPSMLTSNEHSQNLAEVHGDPVPDLHLTVWNLFYRTAMNYPNREAIVSSWQDGKFEMLHQSRSNSPLSVGRSPCLRWTYGQLLRKVNQLASGLKLRNCEPGMQIAAVLWNSASWVLFYWVAAKLGMTFVPIDPRNTRDIRAMVAAINPHIIVTEDSEGSEALDQWSDGINKALLIQTGGAIRRDWIGLASLVSEAETKNINSRLPDATRIGSKTGGDSRNRSALIIFTSGTGREPKGCIHTNESLNSGTWPYDDNADGSTDDKWLIHTPVTHMLAINNASRAFRMGGTVVFPSKSFDVQSTLQALIHERCTIMSATPTLVRSLLANPSFPGRSRLNLSVVSLAGTLIQKADIDLCRTQLGAKDVIQAYGMTEGAPIVSWTRGNAMLDGSYHVGVGKILPGASIRICRPHSHDVLRRGVIGELHISGTSVISKYLEPDSGGLFYQDTHGKWLVTGDRAMIDEEEVLHLFGRYKDLIIRGGINIDPSKIENALLCFPGLEAQVIGVPDDIAGEMPVAVVKLPKRLSTKSIVAEVAKLGPEYILKDIFTLEQLKLEAMPITSLGKVKKGALRNVVSNYMSTRTSRTIKAGAAGDLSTIEFAADLSAVWEEVAGRKPGLRDSVDLFADSITMLRFCDHVYRTMGARMYISDLVTCDTVEKQAKLLQYKAARPTFSAPRPKNKCDLQDGIKADLSQASKWKSFPHSDMFRHPQSVAASPLVALRQADFKYGQLEAVVDVRESMMRMIHGHRPQSYHIRMVFRLKGVEKAKITLGLERALDHHPLFRTVLIQSTDGRWQQGIVRASQRLYQEIIKDQTLLTENEARVAWQDGSVQEHTSTFMFQAKIMHIQESGDHLISMTFNHSIADAISLHAWHKDLDRLINDYESKIEPRTPYLLFSDLYWQLESSHLANLSVQCQVQHLRGISRLQDSLWPKPRSPGWMISDDQGSQHCQTRQMTREYVWGGKWRTQQADFQFPRKARITKLSNVKRMRQMYGITPAIVTMSALVLFNARQTGTNHAIFNTWESGRSWPFVPPWMESLLPSAMSIDGPTAEWILQIFDVRPEETVATFLRRMVRDQNEAKKHQHAPWQKIVEQLREEGPIAMDASYRQGFVWDMSIALTSPTGLLDTGFECLEPVARCDWADCGIFWNAFMVSEDNLMFVASWDTAQMNDQEVEDCCDTLSAFLRQLDQEVNWDKKICDVFETVARASACQL